VLRDSEKSVGPKTNMGKLREEVVGERVRIKKFSIGGFQDGS
jgi:hypothetical protein